MADLSLGDRVKDYYESRTRYLLPRRTNIIIRIDGKSFSSWTRHLDKPFDIRFIRAMQNTALELCSQVQGCKLAYTQSDEISLWVTDYDTLETDCFFDGNIQKIASVTASIATARFNKAAVNMAMDWRQQDLALFDSRVFSIPEVDEVLNYFVFRNNDCERNSIQSLARSKFSQKQLHKKDQKAMQEMLFSEYGINWSKHCTPEEKNGTVISKESGEWGVYPGWKFSKDRLKLKEKAKIS